MGIRYLINNKSYCPNGVINCVYKNLICVFSLKLNLSVGVFRTLIHYISIYTIRLVYI